MFFAIFKLYDCVCSSGPLRPGVLLVGADSCVDRSGLNKVPFSASRSPLSYSHLCSKFDAVPQLPSRRQRYIDFLLKLFQALLRELPGLFVIS